MNKWSFSFHPFSLLAGTIFLIFLLCSSTPLLSQDIDPFYTGLLEKGLRSFLSGDYANAFKLIKISIFGISADKKLLTKAYIYLGFSQYYLKNYKESEIQFRNALELVGSEGFDEIDIDDKSRDELSGVLARFQLGEFSPPEPEIKVVSKPRERPLENSSDNNIEDMIKDLKESIAATPDNTLLYYDLYELYKKEGNKREGRRILEQLVERNPEEIYAFYLLGLLRFQDRRYKDSEKHFEEALRTRRTLVLSQELIEEAKAYQIISTYLRGDKERALDMMATSVHLFTEVKIRQLPLEATDKATLREIIREYVKR
jgi:tetratricopeptide (TPR) repeat protein